MTFPPEWAPQEAVLFSFPRRDGDWGETLDAASKAMVAAANLVGKVTRTIMVVGDADHFAKYSDAYEGAHVELLTNDCWIRDFGPITLAMDSGDMEMVDFIFNGWGGKFAAEKDDEIPTLLHQEMFWDYQLRKSTLELEGGSIESDGHGTILTTTKCLLNPNRNDGTMGKEKMEAALTRELGATRILWLEHGALLGDDTDAHVDTLARFLDERTIAYVKCDDPTDLHFEEMAAMEKEVQNLTRDDGEAYTLIALPWCPEILSWEDGHRLPATYANFLISDGTVFVPTYFDDAAPDHPGRLADARALEVLAGFGKYAVVGVPCRPFIEQHGSLHCLTMQVPSMHT